MDPCPASSYVEEAARVVLALDTMGDSNANGYADLEAALQAAVAAQPRPGYVAPSDQVHVS